MLSKQQILSSFPFKNEWLEKYASLCIEQCEANISHEYGENHHIFPKSIFGDNNITVCVNPAMHFKLHYLLYMAYLNTAEKDIRAWRSVCFAMASFNRACPARTKKLKYCSELEIEFLANMSEERRIANRIAMTGDLNPSRQEGASKKISEGRLKAFMVLSDEDKLLYIEKQRRLAQERSDKLKEFYQSEAGIKQKAMLREERAGKELSEEHRQKILNTTNSDAYRLRMSLISQERVADPEWYNSVYTEEFRAQCSERYKGRVVSEHTKQLMSESKKGKPCPWNIKTNKDPEKIRKTAEKHRGMKRSEEARERIAEGVRRSREERGIEYSHTKGKKLFHNPLNGECHYFFDNEAPEGWQRGRK